jgi:hypothetical protein
LEALADGRDPWIESAEDTGVADGEWGEIVSRADGPRDWTAPEDEEHFDPPEPPPVTAGEPLLVLAWVFTFVGLLGLALVVVLHLTVPWFVPRALGLLAAAGIAALIWRMPHKRTDPDDNGAQV